MMSRQQLKNLANVSNHSESVFETAGDVLFEISRLNWLHSNHQRCSKGASGSTIIIAVNEAIHCINEIKQLRAFIKSVEIQEALKIYITKNWNSLQMCRRNDCSIQKRYRTIESTITKKMKAEKIQKYDLCLDLLSLVIDDSPMNSGSYCDCNSDSKTNSNGKRSRTGEETGMY